MPTATSWPSAAYDEGGGSNEVDGPQEPTRTPNPNARGGFTGSNGRGAVYVFARAGAEWKQTNYLKASNIENGDSFGVSNMLSDDGNTILIGSLDEDCLCTGIVQGRTTVGGNDQPSDTSSGAAYVFVRSGSHVGAAGLHQTDDHPCRRLVRQPARAERRRQHRADWRAARGQQRAGHQRERTRGDGGRGWCRVVVRPQPATLDATRIREGREHHDGTNSAARWLSAGTAERSSSGRACRETAPTAPGPCTCSRSTIAAEHSEWRMLSQTAAALVATKAPPRVPWPSSRARRVPAQATTRAASRRSLHRIRRRLPRLPARHADCPSRATVRLTFHHGGKFLSARHNWVLVYPGQMEAVDKDVEQNEGIIPKDDKRVIADTPMCDKGVTVMAQFTAPQAGDYPFFCSTPGHGECMNGHIARDELTAVIWWWAA